MAVQLIRPTRLLRVKPMMRIV